MSRLKEVLESRNISQTEFIRMTGIPKSTVSEWCSGKYLPRVKTIRIAANALGIKMEDLYEEPSKRIDAVITWHFAKEELPEKNGDYVVIHSCHGHLYTLSFTKEYGWNTQVYPDGDCNNKHAWAYENIYAWAELTDFPHPEKEVGGLDD